MLPAVLMFAIVGCANEYQAAMEERTKAQEELLRILQSIKDPAGLQAASETLARSFDRLAQTNERMNRMRPPSMDVKEQLAKEYGPRLQTAVNESKRELNRIQQLPGGPEFIDRLNNLKSSP